MPIEAEKLRAEGKPVVGIVRNKNQTKILAMFDTQPDQAFTYAEIRKACEIKHPAACHQAVKSLIESGRLGELADAKTSVAHVFLVTQ